MEILNSVFAIFDRVGMHPILEESEHIIYQFVDQDIYQLMYWYEMFTV